MAAAVVSNEGLSESQVKKAVEALLKFLNGKSTDSTEGQQNVLLNTFTPIQLQFVLKKIPTAIKHKCIKMKIPHPLYTDQTGVCLIVSDKERNKNDDHEEFSQQYKDKLVAGGVEHVTEVIPFKQLLTEFRTFESRRKLCHSFDVFLADRKLISQLPHNLGKEFFNTKKMPHPVNLDVANFKGEIYKALNKTYCTMSGSGSCSTFVVGHCGQSVTDVVENVVACVEKLRIVVPGGWSNVRSMNIKTHKSPALPFYCSMASADDVTLDMEIEALSEDEPEDVTTITWGKVQVSKDGIVKVMTKAKLPPKGFKSADDSKKKKRGKRMQKKTEKLRQPQERSPSEEKLTQKLPVKRKSEEEDTNDHAMTKSQKVAKPVSVAVKHSDKKTRRTPVKESQKSNVDLETAVAAPEQIPVAAGKKDAHMLKNQEAEDDTVHRESDKTEKHEKSDEAVDVMVEHSGKKKKQMTPARGAGNMTAKPSGILVEKVLPTGENEGVKTPKHKGTGNDSAHTQKSPAERERKLSPKIGGTPEAKTLVKAEGSELQMPKRKEDKKNSSPTCPATEETKKHRKSSASAEGDRKQPQAPSTKKITKFSPRVTRSSAQTSVAAVAESATETPRAVKARAAKSTSFEKPTSTPQHNEGGKTKTPRTSLKAARPQRKGMTLRRKSVI
ncbi:PREDICTED: ribosomal L1 domain-containing protein 1-like [Priapulus caudatus]|uniref:Ribosomal L1 domain-containing protein 1-like n=1 Tax=Priapulus caudatus TaxID=37621 RepID=A0ABM1E6V5_PRICU|nr:PREDICTED: ribosomal L1 domain-containing protein 1-like [Priapulus caudatus]